MLAAFEGPVLFSRGKQNSTPLLENCQAKTTLGICSERAGEGGKDLEPSWEQNEDRPYSTSSAADFSKYAGMDQQPFFK